MTDRLHAIRKRIGKCNGSLPIGYTIIDQLNQLKCTCQKCIDLAWLCDEVKRLRTALNNIKGAHMDCKAATEEEHKMFHIAEAALYPTKEQR